MATRVADTSYLAEIEAWRRQRYARLREPMSWLTLAGLEWLSEGVNRLGSGADADVRLPAGPAAAGVLARDGSQVVARTGQDGALIHAGRPARELTLLSDADAPPGERPTLLEVGALRMCVIRRGDRIGLRIWDTDSPMRRKFAGIPHYPVDPAWRVVGRFVRPRPGETVAVPDVLGDTGDQPVLGTVVLDLAGGELSIKAVEGDEGRPWLIFADDTNRDETYGAGRFLYVDPPAADGTVVVDFNRAYNPPCVFSPYATCPLPPAENRLPIRVEAGEKRYVAPVGRL